MKLSLKKPKEINWKKILVRLCIGILSSLILSGTFYVYVNRQAFINQITYNEIRSFEYYEKIKDDWEHEPNRIEIPKLGLIARITRPETKEEMDRLLLESVTYNLDSAEPGGEGNIVITGHSSAPTDNEYAHIFATLNKLRYSDEILLYKDLVQYRYLVRKKYFVAADDLSVISQEKNGLTLITCWPTGTDLRRLIIFADSI